MGKKSLFITIFCSVAVVLVLGVFNIVHLTNKPQKPADLVTPVVDKAINEGNNKGSKEDPYYIYDVETFNNLLSLYGSETKVVRKAVMVESVDETTGETVMVEKKDENGKVIYEDVLVDGMQTYEPYHFELYNDIDFSEAEYKILFNNGKAFSGVLNGKGYSVKNVSVSITKENLKDNVYIVSQSVDENKAGAYAHIALFGDTNGATISNINFDEVSINVADDIFSYIQSDEYWSNINTNLREFTIGGIVACAENSTIEANVNITIDADSYSLYAKASENDESKTQGRNCLGGVVGYALNTTITNVENGKSTITIVADSGQKNYYMGGVAGYLVKSEVKFVDVTVDITASADTTADQSTKTMSPLYIGGIAGYVHTSNINNSLVNLTIKQVETEQRYNAVYIPSFMNGYFNMVGGIASVVRANDETQKSVIANTKVFANVNMDCYYGGAVYQVKSTQTSKDTTAIYVTLENLTLNSTVVTLQAYGVASTLVYTEIKYTSDYQYSMAEQATGTERQYNVYLNGKTTASSYQDEGGLTGHYVAAMICSNYTEGDGILHYNPKDFYVLISTQIYSQFRFGSEQLDTFFGSKGYLAFAD